MSLVLRLASTNSKDNEFMTEKRPICIVDAGAKFGIHPSNRKFMDLADHYLLDADDDEIRYLKSFYKDFENIHCESLFLDSSSRSLTFYNYAHPGGHSAHAPDPENLYWSELRPNTSEITCESTVETTTLDKFVESLGRDIDFLKVDVEGHEVELLKGAGLSLKSVLGLRVEIMINTMYRGLDPTFGTVYSYLANKGFVFLNFDEFFSNSFVPFSDFHTKPIFGQLNGADGIWVRDPRLVMEKNDPLEILKYSLFCFANNAEDLAMRVLLAHADRGALLKAGKDMPDCLVEAVEREVARILFSLRDTPRYGTIFLAETYEKLFAKSWVKPGEYYKRYPL
jgi:FkbM family methyltransferase